MEAHVYRRFGEFFVHLFVVGEEFDVAGPFDDELDATLAGERMVCDGGELIPLQPSHGFHPSSIVHREAS